MKFAPVFLLLFLFACQSNSQSNSVKLTPTEFDAKLKASPNAQLVDVRTPEEFQKGHLDGAVNINFYDTDFDQQIGKLSKTNPIFVYCQAGGRSGKACTKLGGMGFKEIYDMIGGYGEWVKKGK